MAVDNGVSIKLTKTDKKRNSTRIITAFSLSMIGYLKQPTSVTNPYIIIETVEDITKYNYMQIASFGRYYYIDDIISLNNDVWEIRAHCDALASFKEQIVNNELYVLRSASDHDTYVFDNKYSITAMHASREDIIAQPLLQPTSWSQGYYVITTISDDATAGVEGVSMYVFQPDDFKVVFEKLFQAYNSGSWGDIADNIRRALYDPMSYIVSCYWYPCNFYAPYTGHFRCGNWDSGHNSKMSNGTLTSLGTYELNIPKHPQAGTYGQYLNGNGFTEYMLDLGVCPPVKLDASLMVRATKLYLTIAVDPLTGLADALVTSNLGFAPLARFTIPFGVPVNLASNKNNMLTALGSVAGAVGNVLSGNVYGAIGNVAQAGINSVKEGVGIVGGGTSSASIAGHSKGYRLYTTFHYVADHDNIDHGAPLCTRKRLGDLSGFTQTDADSISLDGAMENEYSDVLTMLNSGVLIE